METLRWLRLAPLAVVIAAGALGPGRPVSGAGAGPAWDPPPCPAADTGGPPGTGAWYRLDPVLDRSGTLAAQRLTTGIAGRPSRHLDLAPESFASGPVAWSRARGRGRRCGLAAAPAGPGPGLRDGRGR